MAIQFWSTGSVMRTMGGSPGGGDAGIGGGASGGRGDCGGGDSCH